MKRRRKKNKSGNRRGAPIDKRLHRKYRTMTRFNRKELTAIRKRMEQEGYVTLSSFLRDCVMTVIDGKIKLTTHDASEEKQGSDDPNDEK